MIGQVRYALGVAAAVFAVGCADTPDAHEADTQVAYAAQVSASRTLDIPVTLRGSGQATLKANVYANPAATGTSIILSVPGYNATEKVYGGLTAALFADAKVGPGVKQVITVDLPGHGASSKPTGVKFGDLTIEDYADAVVQTIKALGSQSLTPTLVFGYGAGGLTVAAAQEALLESGSSLAALGVRAALLYAPVPSAESPWTQQPANLDTIKQYTTIDDVDGAVYAVSADLWNRQAFTNKAGAVVAGAPSAAEVTAKGYAAPEPAAVLSQLTGVPHPTTGAVVPRPTVRAGAFAPANGTTLTVVSFSEAIQVTAEDVASYYVHLSGDASKSRLAELVAPDAVGNVFIVNPASVIESTHRFFAGS